MIHITDGTVDGILDGMQDGDITDGLTGVTAVLGDIIDGLDGEIHTTVMAMAIIIM